jgi:hypothetical protein
MSTEAFRKTIATPGDNTVKFTRQTNFTGRNGYHKCSGIELWVMNGQQAVNIAPLTSKGVVGRCDIEVPLEDVPALIAALQAIVPAPTSYDETPHEAHCAKRVHGAAECDCIKADMDPDK